jgi:2,3-dihydroxybenzoate decarboxylase
LSRPGNPAGSFREKFCEHFYLTTSGNFSTNALVCSMMEMGVDRIMFSVDWPFAPNKMGTDWLEAAPISHDDKVKIFGGNARRLLRSDALAGRRKSTRPPPASRLRASEPLEMPRRRGLA